MAENREQPNVKKTMNEFAGEFGVDRKEIEEFAREIGLDKDSDQALQNPKRLAEKIKKAIRKRK